VRRAAIGLWAAAALVAACQVGAGWVRSGYGGQVRPPAKDVRTLPPELAGWRAVEEIPLEKRTADILGADSFLSRVYRDPAGETASIQVAVWTDLREGPAGLHYPDVCYPNAGWRILETETILVPTSAGDRPLRLMVMEKP
jgi:EpsI family protein